MAYHHNSSPTLPQEALERGGDLVCYCSLVFDSCLIMNIIPNFSHL